MSDMTVHQLHPIHSSNSRGDSFVKIIDYLRPKGCVFMTPSEYMEDSAEREPASGPPRRAD